ncbi:MAG: M48 family metalloprotease [Gammaproteobacteria bacterium]|nr:M48 family metalloprotease [Gammaproteobacteria bacterium]
MKVLYLIAAAMLCLAIGQPALATGNDLPDIGSAADSMISTDEEYQIGRMVVRGLENAGRVLTDPLIENYIEDVGHKMVAYANDGNLRFNFFVVKDNTLNAFALPGGFVGVNAGLILQTENESELAGVMAHEVAHVTQRHMVRRAQADQRSSMLSTAALIAGLLIAATTGASPDMTTAIVMASQGYSAQQQISHTRANEYEADRVGIGFLASAGFDPTSMADFFGTMSRLSGKSGSAMPEYLRTHPMESSRIAEASDRAAQYPPVHKVDSDGYLLMRERLRVLGADSPDAVLRYYEQYTRDRPGPHPLHIRYGYALAMMGRNQLPDALGTFRILLNERPDIIAFHLGYAETLEASGQIADALQAYQHAQTLFPRNVPVSIAYSNALIVAGDPGQAHRILLDLLNNIPPTAEQARLIATAAGAEGDMANAHYYMSEYHVINGELPLAADQLNLALDVPDLEPVQQARFQARLAEISEYIPGYTKRQTAEARPKQ